MKKMQGECLFCLDYNNKLLKLECGHYCCMNCIPEWYKSKDNVCILCKKKICWQNTKRIK